MKRVKDQNRTRARVQRSGPSKALIAKIGKLRSQAHLTRDDRERSDVYREILRSYRALVSTHVEPAGGWHHLVREALSFLGGQGDRPTSSLAEYDHRKYGPFLGVSDEGGAAHTIRRAAFATPKARALGRDA